MNKRFLRDIAVIQTGPFGSQLHKEDYVDVEPEVDKYLFCDVEFGVTDKFVKKYKK